MSMACANCAPNSQPLGAMRSRTTTRVRRESGAVIISDNPPLDTFYYPDSDKWGMRPPGKLFRLTEVDYFDGEG